MVCTQFAFAAVKQDGSVVTWGAADVGGESGSVKDQLTGGVDNVVGNSGAFAAVKQDGSVVTWGDHMGSVVTWGSADHGGNSDSVQSELQGRRTSGEGKLARLRPVGLGCLTLLWPWHRFHPILVVSLLRPLSQKQVNNNKTSTLLIFRDWKTSPHTNFLKTNVCSFGGGQRKFARFLPSHWRYHLSSPSNKRLTENESSVQKLSNLRN